MLLTVDIGTSFFKSALWNFEGDGLGCSRAGFASAPLSIDIHDGLRHETDSSQWLKAFANCCSRLFTAASPASVEAVVISGNGPSLAPVFGPPVYSSENLSAPAAPARLWLDRRAVQAAQQVSALAGGFVDAGFFLPKALDIKINEPELYEKTGFFLGCPELLMYTLTGAARTIFPSDGFDRWFWNDAILDALHLDRDKFPSFIRPGEICGGLTAQAASLFGLNAGIPVIAGGPDFYAAILGSGVSKPGQVCDRAGTSEGINVCTETCITDNRLMSYRHPVKPFWNLSGVISTTGKAIEWGCRFLGLSTVHEFLLLAETADAGSGDLVFLPYLAGERAPLWDPAARGLLRGINLSSGRPEFARAVLEGIGFAIRDIIAVMEDAGAVVHVLFTAGSGGAGGLLNHIKADITGKPLHIPQQKETELLGLAVIGACTLGKYPSLAEAASSLVQTEETITPNVKNAELYDTLFMKYKKMKLCVRGE